MTDDKTYLSKDHGEINPNQEPFGEQIPNIDKIREALVNAKSAIALDRAKSVSKTEYLVKDKAIEQCKESLTALDNLQRDYILIKREDVPKKSNMYGSSLSKCIEDARYMLEEECKPIEEDDAEMLLAAAKLIAEGMTRTEQVFSPISQKRRENLQENQLSKEE